MHNRIRQLTLLIVLLFSSAGSFAALPASVDGQPLPSLAPLLERVTPSVVNIHSRARVQTRRSPLMDDPFFQRFFNLPSVPRERLAQSLGSGVIVDADQGFILTNNHVVEGAEEIFVSLHDGRTLPGSLIGADPDTDLAVIRIESEGLAALPLADSDELRVGDFVVAVGNPFGLGQTVTSGIVSALGRVGVRGLEFQNFIQTDASINPGNSGGALVNLRGELVGVNTAIFTPSGGNVGIGFAIPSGMASYVMQQLVTTGEVRRGSLGLEVQSLTPELAGAFGLDSGFGAVVAAVDPESAADQAGLQPGDVIVAVNSKPVNNAQDFRNAEGLMPLGERVELEFLRDGERDRARVLVEEILALHGARIDPRLQGGLFEPLPDEWSARLPGGVWLASVEQGSRLWRQGLEAGDVILSVNRQPVSGLREFEQLVKSARGRLDLQIRRRGQTYLARLP